MVHDQLCRQPPTHVRLTATNHHCVQPYTLTRGFIPDTIKHQFVDTQISILSLEVVQRPAKQASFME